MPAGFTKRILQIGSVVILQAAVFFGSAGRLDWWGAWAYLAVYVGVVALAAVWLLPRGQELIAERSEIRQGTKGWDLILTRFMTGFMVAAMVVAGLDLRYGWSVPLPLWLEVAALVMVAAGYLLFVWAMTSNPFFSAIVRIQTDRGHQVATGGPYRWVRHPGYAGMAAFNLAMPVLLGSWWALVPSAVTFGLIVVRTALEDRTLMTELEGYGAYASEVHNRLIPGVW